MTDFIITRYQYISTSILLGTVYIYTLRVYKYSL